ncbi:MAG: hypothetical protein AMXMBFR81_00260 [Chthonomonas sp.]|nr:Rrf2 family transcriptional regulator [Fimbriimonadaceae bacterium]
MLSLTMEYALRAAAHLAERPGEAQSVKQIAEATQVPADYLAKVMRDLTRAGIVASKPGRTGGYALNPAALDRSLWEIASAVETIRMTEGCPLGNPCHRVKLCPMHRALRDAEQAFRSCMTSATLRSLKANHARDARLAAKGVVR